MTTSRFIDVLKEITSNALGDFETVRNKSFAWYMSRVGVLREGVRSSGITSANINPEDFLRLQQVASNRPTYFIGRLIMFKYDAKWKAQLPYWDMFPLIFPIEIHFDGFLGINLHYLPLRERAILMDALYSLMLVQEPVSIKDKLDNKDRLLISYQILKGVSRYRNYKPCVKKYLTNHIRSRFAVIPLKHWETSLFLPLANWQKAPESRVWTDSLRMI